MFVIKFDKKLLRKQKNDIFEFSMLNIVIHEVNNFFCFDEKLFRKKIK